MLLTYDIGIGRLPRRNVNAMDKKDWGVRRVCLTCGARFYDFSKSPIICPSCSAVFDPEYLSKRKAKAVHEKSEAVVDDIDEVIVDGEVDGTEDDLSDEDIDLDNDKN
jgi:uncharacterized protein (TIGR02300 family)